MAFPATITLTVNAVAKVLNRVNQDSYGSEYSLIDTLDSWNLKIRHTEDSPDGDGLVMRRHNVFVEHVVYPTPTALMQKDTVSLVMRQDKNHGPTDMINICKAVNVWLGAATNIADLGAGIN
ncbi:coat protein [ssRNA phage SRR7976357_12]|uniref:Coat protein n=1 Tax=ssRNA phage SRR7976357_12 TaxID=2786741 RepID=A0A8S5L5L3_9VIRU|nr:coat protein [ssRNA phage SRR7976357_12]DAD52820.1 TPA_asm: coat protein [ssRNA phage SRR7976357_12]